jgi:hypothetical protein
MCGTSMKKEYQKIAAVPGQNRIFLKATRITLPKSTTRNF